MIACASEPQTTLSLNSGSTGDFAGLKVVSLLPGQGFPRRNSAVFLIEHRVGALLAAEGFGRDGPAAHRNKPAQQPRIEP